MFGKSRKSSRCFQMLNASCTTPNFCMCDNSELWNNRPVELTEVARGRQPRWSCTSQKHSTRNHFWTLEPDGWLCYICRMAPPGPTRHFPKSGLSTAQEWHPTGSFQLSWRSLTGDPYGQGQVLPAGLTDKISVTVLFTHADVAHSWHELCQVSLPQMPSAIYLLL